ncbi:hypothetical protein HOD29_02300 [archaeon]|jgi:hypothetical protein|nr:hypothetical protein [archaeon]
MGGGRKIIRKKFTPKEQKRNFMTRQISKLEKELEDSKDPNFELPDSAIREYENFINSWEINFDDIRDREKNDYVGVKDFYVRKMLIPKLKYLKRE